MAPPRLAIGVATRPYPGETANGDACSIAWHAGGCRITLLDGVGHGPSAAAAALAACESLRSQPALAPVEALQACHRALLGTRGAVAAVAAISPEADRLTFAGVGNIEARLLSPEREQRPISYRGILGVTARTIRTFDFELVPDWCLVLHTDGVSSHAEIPSLSVFGSRDMQALADAILSSWGKVTDDATVATVCAAG